MEYQKEFGQILERQLKVKIQTILQRKSYRQCNLPGKRSQRKRESQKMIRTINERLRTNKNILVSKDKSGISNILFALRSEKGIDGKAAFVRQNGRNPNTLKTRIFEKCILEQDPKTKIEPEDYSDEVDSNISVREKVRGTKLEGAFKKKRGKVLKQSDHTITIMPKGSKGTKTYSKRDVANNGEMPNCSKTPIQNKKASESAKNKRPQKKRGLENQDLGQPKSKIVNKLIYTEETTDEESDQQEEVQNMTQNAIPVQKEVIESNPSPPPPETTTK